VSMSAARDVRPRLQSQYVAAVVSATTEHKIPAYAGPCTPFVNGFRVDTSSVYAIWMISHWYWSMIWIFVPDASYGLVGGAFVMED